ncbi:hypothetical protein G6S93_004409 [Salmonella enterica]|nr:hypothetical protein [Salmonella enterica]
MDLEALRMALTNPDVLLNNPPELIEAIREKIRDLSHFHNYTRIEYKTPYKYQQEFMEAGKRFNFRFLRAGNRVGKTWCGAYEMATHITGRYPDWWKGRKIEGSGRLYWCVGVDLKMVRDIQQKELLGTANATITEAIGTGTIPRECIRLDKGVIKDGPRIESIQIKHVDGGYNTLEFFGSTDKGQGLMGKEVIFAWVDEESPYSEAIWSQLNMRVANADGPGADGSILITATPEVGETPLNKRFVDNESGIFYLRQITWWDVPERYPPDVIERKLSALAEWERDMRSKGLPAVGKGAVFKFSDKEISVAEVAPLPHWIVNLAVDWGHVRDPSVVVATVYDPDNDIDYILDIVAYLDKSEQDRSPAGVAAAILNSPYRNVPVIVPHDSGLDSDASESNGKMLARYGVIVDPQPFRNPADTQLRIQSLSQTSNKSVRKIETGLQEMRYLFQLGKLKVLERCEQWFKEKHSYSYSYNETTQTLGYAGADHVIDASRYAILSRIAGKGCLWSEREHPTSYNNSDYSALQLNF